MNIKSKYKIISIHEIKNGDYFKWKSKNKGDRDWDLMTDSTVKVVKSNLKRYEEVLFFGRKTKKLKIG